MLSTTVEFVNESNPQFITFETDGIHSALGFIEDIFSKDDNLVKAVHIIPKDD